MIWLRIFTLVLGVVLAVPVAGPASAGVYQQASGDQDEALKARRSGKILSMSQIIRIVRRRFGGRQVDAYLSAGKRFYYLIWKSRDNEVLRITVDARTGEIVRVRRGRG